MFRTIRIIFAVFAVGFIFIAPKIAEAGFIVQRPLYIGLTNGLVGSWSFDAPTLGTTSARDLSGNDNTGFFINGPTKAIGRIGQALSFDGSDDYVQVAHNALLIPSNITVSAWVRPQSSIDAGDRIAGKDTTNGLEFSYSLDSKGEFGGSGPQFLVANGSSKVTGSDLLVLDTWQHVVGTYDGTDIKIYVNGALKGTTNSPGLSIGQTQPLRIGRRGGDSGFFFTGPIDEVRIYNRALSEEEIKRLYRMGATFKINKPLAGNSLDRGLVGSWSFDAPTLGTTSARDLSGNDNTGFFINGPTKAIGRIGQALEFDGSRSDVVVTMGVNANLNLSTQTNVAWIKLATSSPDTIEKTIYAYASVTGGGSFFRIVGDEVRWLWGGGCCTHDTSGVGLKADVWYHVAATYTDTATTNNVKIYVDGVLWKTGNETINPISTPDVTPTIGCRESSGTFNTCLGGLIDDVRIYNRALSEEEIKRLYRSATFKINKPLAGNSLDRGLVGSWSFDAPTLGTTSARDLSGNDNTGFFINGPTKAIGRIGQALSFDGSNDFVNAGSAANLDNLSAISVSAWINPRSRSDRYIVTKNEFGTTNGWAFYFSSTGNCSNTAGRLSFLIDYATQNQRRCSVTDAVPLGTWSQVVATWDGSTLATGMHLYLNGTEVSYAAVDLDASGARADDSTRSLNIGNDGNGGATALNGLLDDVRVYNRALSADEIRRLYNMGR